MDRDEKLRRIANGIVVLRQTVGGTIVIKAENFRLRITPNDTDTDVFTKLLGEMAFFEETKRLVDLHGEIGYLLYLAKWVGSELSQSAISRFLRIIRA